MVVPLAARHDRLVAPCCLPFHVAACRPSSLARIGAHHPDPPNPPVAHKKQAVIEVVLEGRLPPQVAGLNRGLRRAWKVRF